MPILESFPTQDDWEELFDEMESDLLNPRGIVRPESKEFGPLIEPDWDVLLED